MYLYLFTHIFQFWLSCLDPLVYLLPLNYLAFQSFDYEPDLVKVIMLLFQKHILLTVLDMYVFITMYTSAGALIAHPPPFGSHPPSSQCYLAFHPIDYERT